MNREFTKREKTLLVILVVILLFVGYIKLYMEPLNNKIDTFTAKTADEQTELDTNMITAAKMKRMEKEISEAKGKSDFKEIPEFDNSRAVMKELYSILDSTDDYVLTFGEIRRDDYIVVRPVSLSFVTKNYESARKIIDKLSSSQYIVELGNLNIKLEQGKATNNEITYQTKLELTYYEAEY